MQLRKKAPVTFLLAAFVILGTVGVVVYRTEYGSTEARKRRRLTEVEAEAKSGIAGMGRGAEAYAQFIAQMPAVRSGVETRNRSALIALVGSSFEMMKKKFGAEQAMFEDAELSTFLILHRLDLAGVYSSSRTREMLVRAKRDREVQSGPEVSMSAGVTVRAIAPITSGDRYLGSFEWGVSFTRTLARLKDNTGADMAVYLEESSIQAPTTDTGRAAAAAAAKAADGDRPAEGYRTVDSTDIQKVNHVVSHEFLDSVQQETVKWIVTPDADLGVIAFPLTDFNQRHVGAVVAVYDMTDLDREFRTNAITIMVAFAIGAILLMGIVQVVFNGFLVRPLVELSESLDAVVKGDLTHKIDLTKRKDEIGAMARTLEKLRERLAREQELGAGKVADKVSGGASS